MIVGAGLVGLSCALALAQRGFSVVIVESQATTPTKLKSVQEEYDAKVFAITRATQNFLDHLGVWSAIKQSRTCAYQHMKVWDSVADGNIHFSADDFFEPDLGHIIEQSVMMGALGEALAQCANVNIITSAWPVDFQQHEKSATLTLQQGTVLESPLVIAADGANSNIRKMCQVESKSWSYEQSAIVATVQGTISHRQTAYQRFAADGPLALLPLADPDKCSIVWTTTPQNAKQICELSPPEFGVLLTKESDGVMGKMHLVGKRFSFNLQTHHAKKYAVPRCVLVGDSAHTLHPLAGQGVNLGFMDVAILVDILDKIKTKGRDWGFLSVLQRYERQRRTHNQIMIWAMELFKRGFCSQSSFIQRLRNIGLNWVDQRMTIKQFFANVALGRIGPVPALAKASHHFSD